MNRFIKLILGGIIIALAVVLVFKNHNPIPSSKISTISLWPVQSIDTMKFSRDIARAKMNDSTFDIIIDKQISNIAATGATHVAIDTPYDEEFTPFLYRWVKAARVNNLHVWFRGNWSGWEGWFGYPKITRSEHLNKTKDFINKHQDLFQDGDIFTACPECENGGPGDPRQTGDVSGFRQFMVDEYQATQATFNHMGRQVASNYDSMNGDVARLVMDKDTTTAMGGIVTIDHYVATPDKLASEIHTLSNNSGGKIVLGEYGAPIPGINQDMNEQQQSDWMNESLGKLEMLPEVVGINYWVSNGGSTQIWNVDDSPRMAVGTLKSFYIPTTRRIIIKNALDQSLTTAHATFINRGFVADKNGVIILPNSRLDALLKINADGYGDQSIALAENSEDIQVRLVKTDPSLWFKCLNLIYGIFK